MSEIPIEARKCRHCGEWVRQEDDSSKQPNQRTILKQPSENTRPGFAIGLAWWGAASNAGYFVFTLYSLFQDLPNSLGRHLLVLAITGIFVAIYAHGAKTLGRLIFDLSTALAIIGVLFALVVFGIASNSDALMGPPAAFVTGSIIWLIANVIGLNQVKKFNSNNDNTKILKEPSECLKCGSVIGIKDSSCNNCGWSYENAGRTVEEVCINCVHLKNKTYCSLQYITKLDPAIDTCSKFKQ
jgi:hypothetical protein